MGYLHGFSKTTMFNLNNFFLVVFALLLLSMFLLHIISVFPDVVVSVSFYTWFFIVFNRDAFRI